MNTKLLGLLAAATLATAACSQEKKTEETTTITTPETTTTTTTVDTTAYRSEADALAARVAEDLKLTDTTVVRRIKTVYYTRGRKLNSYTTDTTGRYAAAKAANDEANQQIKTIITDPAQYSTYSSNLGTYYAGQPYTVVVADAAAKPSLAQRVGQGSGIKKMEREEDGDTKTKFGNGAKIKRESDGSLKIKRADGTKVKIDEEGNRTVK
ncbi:hypothetical protein [Hymenobacter terrenus]|uniref:hypothetical protein n=1 Tax=Hymenobacter terrenus TaxID=1629124 RepID=UPI000619E0D7|nr:hypothetical protein [Hymenobacter terrenus]